MRPPLRPSWVRDHYGGALPDETTQPVACHEAVHAEHVAFARAPSREKIPRNPEPIADPLPATLDHATGPALDGKRGVSLENGTEQFLGLCPQVLGRGRDHDQRRRGTAVVTDALEQCPERERAKPVGAGRESFQRDERSAEGLAIRSRDVQVVEPLHRGQHGRHDHGRARTVRCEHADRADAKARQGGAPAAFSRRGSAARECPPTTIRRSEAAPERNRAFARAMREKRRSAGSMMIVSTTASSSTRSSRVTNSTGTSKGGNRNRSYAADVMFVRATCSPNR